MDKEPYALSIANALWRYGKMENNELSPIFHNLPEKFKVPSIFFPVQEITSDRDTLSSFKFTYLWNVKVFGTSTEEAFSIVSRIQRELASKKWRVPILNKDSSETGEYITLQRPSVREVNDLVVMISFSWDERCYYDYKQK